MKPPVNQKPAEQKSDSKVLSLNGTSGLNLKPVLKSGSSRRGKRGKRSGVLDLPPTLSTVITIRHRYRFTSTAVANAVSSTVGNILIAMGGIVTVVNSTVTSFCSSFRIRSISIWPGVSTSNEAAAEVVWLGAGGSYARDESKLTQVPLGITVERAVRSRPPRDSFASIWQLASNGSATVFQLTCPSGSVIELDVQGTLSNNLGGYAQSGYTTATLGTWQYGRLDGVGGKFTQIGAPNVAN